MKIYIIATLQHYADWSSSINIFWNVCMCVCACMWMHVHLCMSVCVCVSARVCMHNNNTKEAMDLKETMIIWGILEGGKERGEWCSKINKGFWKAFNHLVKDLSLVQSMYYIWLTISQVHLQCFKGLTWLLLALYSFTHSINHSLNTRKQ